MNKSVQASQKSPKNSTVKTEVLNPTEITPGILDGFVEGNGIISIKSEHYTNNVAAGDVRREKNRRLQ